MVSSAALVAAVLAAGFLTMAQMRVSQYVRGLAVVRANGLVVAVPATAARELRAGQAVVVSSPSGTSVRTTLVRVEGPTARHRLPALTESASGDRVLVGHAPAVRRLLGSEGSVLPARVEVARTSLLSQLPLVDRLG